MDPSFIPQLLGFVPVTFDPEREGGNPFTVTVIVALGDIQQAIFCETLIT